MQMPIPTLLLKVENDRGLDITFEPTTPWIPASDITIHVDQPLVSSVMKPCS